MKRCYKCKEIKSLSEFNKNKGRKDGHAGACRSCMKILRKSHYRNNTQKVREEVKARKIKIRDEIWTYKSRQICQDCGETDPVVLEFDHIVDKYKDVSRMVADGFSLKRIMNEIAKCQVVCCNCHRRRTAKRGGWDKKIVI